jgi:hypothetical protein
MNTFATAIYPNEEKAHEAVAGLVEASFSHTDISVVKSDGKDAEHVAVEHRTGVAEGAGTGAVIGSAAGGLGAVLMATGMIGGPIGLIAAGPILAALQGALAGGAAGTLAGALVGLGFWKEEADFEAGEIEKGGILVGVDVPEGRIDEVKDVFQRTGCLRMRA